MVCLHGLRGTPADWTGVQDGLPADWRVETPALPAEPSEALAVAQAAICRGSFVLAHSMGAAVAMRVLQEHPRPVAGLVLTGSFFPPARNGRSRTAAVADYLGHRLALAGQVAGRRRSGERSERSRRALALLLRQAARPLDGAKSALHEGGTRPRRARPRRSPCAGRLRDRRGGAESRVDAVPARSGRPSRARRSPPGLGGARPAVAERSPSRARTSMSFSVASAHGKRDRGPRSGQRSRGSDADTGGAASRV